LLHQSKDLDIRDALRINRSHPMSRIPTKKVNAPPTLLDLKFTLDVMDEAHLGYRGNTRLARGAVYIREQSAMTLMATATPLIGGIRVSSRQLV
jgi:hypothetical protein